MFKRIIEILCIIVLVHMHDKNLSMISIALLLQIILNPELHTALLFKSVSDFTRVWWCLESAAVCLVLNKGD